MNYQVSAVIEFPGWAGSVGQAAPQELLMRLFGTGQVDEIILRALGFTPTIERADALPDKVRHALQTEADECVITIPLSSHLPPTARVNIVERIADLNPNMRVVAWTQEIVITASHQGFRD